ncbi:MAG TPA: hypothetical protein VFR34_07580, partial [Paracoccaceae bacterium]|nr:hypothetical protein [Paracoccaceae bacterium]
SAQRFGLTAKGNDLPNPSRVVRYVPYGKMRRDEDDNYIGPLPSAFEERPADGYLSVTWCEYFNGAADAQLRCAVEAIRGSNIAVKPKACFCVAETSEVLAAIAEFGHAGRAVYLPEKDNHAHAGVFGIPPDEAQLLARLADEVWSVFLTRESADVLPLNACSKSPTVD